MKNTSVAARRPVSLSLLALTGLLSMGSGYGGNSGCSPSDSPDCTELCSVEGSYQLTFEDTSPLPQACREHNLALPTGALVISRDDGQLTIPLHDVEVEGSYFGQDSSYISLRGSRPLPTPMGHNLIVSLEGRFDPQPETISEPSVLKGTYKIYTPKPSETDLPCDVTRAFTATR
jgi:hypothetical protein